MSDETPLREVRLYGWLGERYGRVFHLAVRSPAEAVRLLAANFPGFYTAFTGGSNWAHTRYKVWVGRRRITSAADATMQGTAPIRIAPVVQGAAKAGLVQTIVGITLIAAGMAINFVSSGQPFAGPGTFLINIGAALTIGGVVQMLSPVPKAQKAADQDGSTYLDTPTNFAAAGNPVPVAIGRVFAGSVVISAGLHVEQLNP